MSGFGPNLCTNEKATDEDSNRKFTSSEPCLVFPLSASIPFFACELKTVKAYERGFFCGDSSITYPYIEREAIPDSMLIAGGIIITGLTVGKVQKWCGDSR